MIIGKCQYLQFKKASLLMEIDMLSKEEFENLKKDFGSIIRGSN
jgi:hypothetical protein